MSNDTRKDRKRLLGGFRMTTAHEQPISDEQFLRSYAIFGCLLRWRNARALLDVARIHSDNEELRMALSAGIYQQLGFQIEDLVVFFVAIERWVNSGKQPFLADHFHRTFVRSSGDESPAAMGERLKTMSGDAFLAILGLPKNQTEWPNPSDFQAALESRTVLAGVLDAPNVIRSMTNKIKHGPQLTLQSLKELEPTWTGPNAIYVRLLFNGAKVAQEKVDDPNPTDLYLYDELVYLVPPVQQIEAVARQLCGLSLVIYGFTFKRQIEWTPHASWLTKGPSPVIW